MCRHLVVLVFVTDNSSPPIGKRWVIIITRPAHFFILYPRHEIVDIIKSGSVSEKNPEKILAFKTMPSPMCFGLVPDVERN